MDVFGGGGVVVLEGGLFGDVGGDVGVVVGVVEVDVVDCFVGVVVCGVEVCGYGYYV